MVTVYSAPNTRAIRVIWVLEEIGAKAEIKSMPYPPRQHAPDYFAVNPTGMVPLLIDGEVRLSESMAICDYLATKHRSPLVVPPNDPERPQFLQWLWYGESTLMTPLSRLAIVRQVERKFERKGGARGRRPHRWRTRPCCRATQDARAASRGPRLPRRRAADLGRHFSQLSASPGRHAGRRQSAGTALRCLSPTAARAAGPPARHRGQLEYFSEIGNREANQWSA